MPPWNLKLPASIAMKVVAEPFCDEGKKLRVEKRMKFTVITGVWLLLLFVTEGKAQEKEKAAWKIDLETVEVANLKI